MKLTKIYGLAAMSLLLAIFVSCEEDNSKDSSLTDFVGLQAFANVELLAGSTSNIQTKVYASNTSSSDRTFTLVVDETTTTLDPANYTVPATVTIPAGSKEGTFEVSVNAIGLGNGKEIHIGLAPQAGVNFPAESVTLEAVDPADPIRNIVSVVNSEFVLKVTELCVQNKFRIQIAVDGYGSETTWELYDSDLNIVANGGPYEDQKPGSGETAKLCLADGSYTFVIYDGAGDGMFDGENQGFYKLIKVAADGAQTVIAQNGTFGSSETFEFSVP